LTSPETGPGGLDDDIGNAAIGDPNAAAAEDDAAAAIAAGLAAAGLDGGGAEDAGTCKFVHAWVLVLPGKREVAEAVFIEPSSGRKYPLADSPYRGIEMLWNHRNFWVCLQQPAPHSDSRADPREISYELNDPSKWEPVFEDRGLWFLAWTFPDDWEPTKPTIAAHTRHFLAPHTAAPPPPGSNPHPATVFAHAIWASFTYCYFRGARHIARAQLSVGAEDAVRWLERMVGEYGWQEQGPVFGAVRNWVEATRARLLPLFPAIGAAGAAEWAAGLPGGAGVERELAERRADCDQRFAPVYPYRVTGGFSANRVKVLFFSAPQFTVKSIAAPRDVSGTCGVPASYGQTKNCALGFLVLADL
ncbi:Coiled-coil domain-containing protein lobo, partial [Tetrabaena socialis]